ncbi:hypothetical protein CDL15_Pgr014924 [Punica granatum]|uniref:Uncharacterized protein n=1 Tax=Punica granatum TaxID=22663 RepID=A0A218Y1E5_PUNGR|nr:hypothetical protein CDL15_Pgr014924 [Punica granatum]
MVKRGGVTTTYSLEKYLYPTMCISMKTSSRFQKFRVNYQVRTRVDHLCFTDFSMSVQGELREEEPQQHLGRPRRLINELLCKPYYNPIRDATRDSTDRSAIELG